MRSAGSAIDWSVAASWPTSTYSAAPQWRWPTTPDEQPATSTPSLNRTASCWKRPVSSPLNSAFPNGGSTSRRAHMSHLERTWPPRACSTILGFGSQRHLPSTCCSCSARGQRHDWDTVTPPDSGFRCGETMTYQPLRLIGRSDRPTNRSCESAGHSLVQRSDLLLNSYVQGVLVGVTVPIL